MTEAIADQKTSNETLLLTPASRRTLFTDPDDMAGAITGGRHGILPLTKEKFIGEVISTPIDRNISCSSAAFKSDTSLRVFLEHSKNIDFFLPSISGNHSIVNGKVIKPDMLHASAVGDFHTLKTGAIHKAGKISVNKELLRELTEKLKYRSPHFRKQHMDILSPTAGIPTQDDTQVL